MELAQEELSFSDFVKIMFNGSCWQMNVRTAERVAYYYTVMDPGKILEAQDKIHRALGIIKSAMLMDHSEAMQLLSLVRLGVSEKKLETLSTDSIDKLIVEIQPASIMTRYGDDMSPRDRDIKRAEILRDRFN